MVNNDLLRKKIASKGKTICSLSKDLGINPATFYRKIQSNGFKCLEVQRIAELLDLSSKDFESIFFAVDVAYPRKNTSKNKADEEVKK